MKYFVAALLLLGACGTRPPDIIDPSATLFPLAVGNRWEFRVQDNGEIETKVQTITSTLAVNARRAYAFVTENGLKRTESIQILDGPKLLRVSEQEIDHGVRGPRVVFGPPSLRLDTAIDQLGATYEDHHTEVHLQASDGTVLSWTSKDHTFFVEAVDDEVIVPAGNFRAVRLRRDTVAGPSKTFWYVRGVGKIKEVGGQTEELSAYTIQSD